MTDVAGASDILGVQQAQLALVKKSTTTEKQFYPRISLEDLHPVCEEAKIANDKIGILNRRLIYLCPPMHR